jgi:hypothetical protein
MTISAAPSLVWAPKALMLSKDRREQKDMKKLKAGRPPDRRPAMWMRIVQDNASKLPASLVAQLLSSDGPSRFSLRDNVSA